MLTLVSKALRNPDWIWRIVMLALMLGQYYLQSSFVPRVEYVKDKELAASQLAEDHRVWWDKLSKMSDSMTAIDIAVKMMDRNTSTIHDHENRIRALESRVH